MSKAIPPKTAFLKVVPYQEEIDRSVRKALEYAGFGKYKGRRVFLKINAMNHFVIPGTNTSPWLLESMLRILQRQGAEILAGDGDLCSCKNVDLSGRNWGYKKLIESYGAKYINLTKEQTQEADFKGHIGKARIPKILHESDAIISMPVMKTHAWSVITASLKNQFGCFPVSRHTYHLNLDEAIVKINQFLKPQFTLIDGTINLEGNGPRTGTPKINNILIASRDLVAADTLAARFMGFDPKRIGHITLAEKEGLGKMESRILGDEFRPSPFVPATDSIVSLLHKKLRHSPMEKLLFHTRLFNALTTMAMLYSRYWWYEKTGKPAALEIIRNTPYGQEYKKLFENMVI